MKNNVLVVDDDESFRWLMNEILKHHFNVHTVSGSISAMKWLSDGNLPSVILCDHNLPLVNGVELKEKLNISGSYSEIPFILISAVLDSRLADKCEKAGICDYVQKPFDPKQFPDYLLKVVGSKTSLIVNE